MLVKGPGFGRNQKIQDIQSLANANPKSITVVKGKPLQISAATPVPVVTPSPTPVTPPTKADVGVLGVAQMSVHNTSGIPVAVDVQDPAVAAATPIAGIGDAAHTLTGFTTNAFGKVTAAVATLIAIACSQVASSSAVKTANYTITIADYLICGEPGAAATITITLPEATGSGRRYMVKMTNNAAAGVITIAPNGTDTIEGGTTLTIAAQYKSYTLVDAKTALWVIEAST